ncbi:MAG: UDP-N-acetylmuramoyl-L-alanyl-D-glutamate--2,6-diaminopimelate ligase [Desulfovibrio sp.]|nr:UDP-N-acetylmuramoyl-L-alanyl-D-glutamate--2,6-diaminopimelate ligase [Desulfovibrio sp.]MBI4959763.1 UDP-N-acetylmuramoyl-L-alanyl-D-glutamate--2,6-diaminopimelate ligase [Desulfovibrio sp.]
MVSRNPDAWIALKALVTRGLEVRTDSRRVQPGEVFVAVPGATRDGSEFIPMAVERGAAHVVAANGAAWPQNAKAALYVHDNPRQALGELAAARYGTASLGFKLAGVTGTNGKTTITYLVEHIVAAAGGKPAVVGTVEYRWPGHREDASHTTPGCLKLHALMGAMQRDGVTAAMMEVSSHALDQGRVEGLLFDVAALTNVTQDHLDYHGQMETYFQAKRRFFTTYLASKGVAVINYDDPYGRRLLEEYPDALGYGMGEAGVPARALKGRVISSSGKGLQLEMEYGGKMWTLGSPLIGTFNAANLLTAQAIGLGLGLPVEALQSLSNCYGAPGRLERVQNDHGLNVFVDYAHTPDALENVLRALKSLDFGKVVAVFGCGGNRDRAKRPLMAEAVAKWADVAVLTSDNPRHEDPLTIMEDAKPGLEKAARAVLEQDRRKAIRLALDEIGPNDALLIAGKGHETYQQIGDVKHSFNDVTVVKELLA